MKKVSIIIPSKNSGEDFTKILEALEAQTYKDFEVIVIDSRTDLSKKIAEEINSFSSKLAITLIEDENLLPGVARNKGSNYANNEILAFLDSKTIPKPDWLKLSLEIFLKNELCMLVGSFRVNENNLSRLQKYILFATYGYKVSSSLPGTLISKKRFLETGGFLNVRAGEDLEWFDRSQESLRLMHSNNGMLEYEGLPKSLSELWRKWFLYSLENAKIDVEKIQKSFYFASFTFFILYFFFSWNYFFPGTKWNESPLFVPHINKIAWLTILAIYFFIRSIYLPIKKEVKKKDLFPLNWLLVGLIGLTIDLVKLPGRFLGFIIFVKIKLLDQR